MRRQKNGIWKLTDAEMEYFAIVTGEASLRYKETGYHNLSKEADAFVRYIYYKLESAGYFKGRVSHEV